LAQEGLYTGGVPSCLPFEPALLDSAREAEWFAALPASAAVFVLRARSEGAEPYIGKTANLRRRLHRLLASPQGASPGRRLNLRERVRSVEWQPVGGDFEAGFALYRLLRAEFPHSYAARLHLRPAPLLHWLRENAYPRLAVTGRIRSLRAAADYFGPFASRAEAEQYANDSLDFFLLRRCTDELHPDPNFPGCVYSEMKMCLAPCFRGCTDERYAEEAARMVRYLETGGHSLLVEIGRARDEASERLEYEAAAAAHARLEKLKAVQSRHPAVVRRIDRLNGVLLQPSHLSEHIALFRIAGGMLAPPVAFDVSERASQTTGLQFRSMEARIREALSSVEVTPPQNAQQWMEHLAILKRWYYRTNKVGELFLEEREGALPMRRVVRAVGRVRKGEKPADDANSFFAS
jgi:excinuclease ABC subunit C